MKGGIYTLIIMLIDIIIIINVRMYDVLLYHSMLPIQDKMSPSPTAEHTATPRDGTSYTSTETDTSSTRLSAQSPSPLCPYSESET